MERICKRIVHLGRDRNYRLHGHFASHVLSGDLMPCKLMPTTHESLGFSWYGLHYHCQIRQKGTERDCVLCI
jgi:hypothetical protein